MKINIQMIVLTSLIAITIVMILYFVVSSKESATIKNPTTMIKNIDVKNNDVNDIKTVGAEDIDIKKPEAGYTDSAMSDTGIEEKFAHLIAESKKSAVERTSEGVRYVDGEWITETYTYTEYKRIQISIDLPEVVEYVKLARAQQGLYIPDDVEPIVEIQGEWIVITFPCPTEDADGMPMPPGPDFYARVIIDIKTKVMLGVEAGS